MTTFYSLLEAQLRLVQKEKYGDKTTLPVWFIEDYLESLAKDLIRRYDEENTKK